MDVDIIMQVVGSLGFPIVACAAMFWDNRETRKSHKEEMSQMTQALQNNTNVLNDLKGVIKDGR